MQPAARPPGQAGQGRRARRRRVPDRVHDHRRVRRHLDGPRGHAGVARVAGGHRRLGRDGDARRAVRRDGHLRRLRQVAARHADGRRPPRPAVGVRLRRLDPARAGRRRPSSTSSSVFEAVGAYARGTIVGRGAQGDRVQRLPHRGQLRRACSPPTPWPPSPRRSGMALPGSASPPAVDPRRDDDRLRPAAGPWCGCSSSACGPGRS